MGQNRLTVDELGENDAVLATISSAGIQNFSGDYLSDTGDRKVVLQFDEFGDAELVLNATSFRALADRYGNDRANNFQAWLGKPCVLVRVDTNTPDGAKVQSVWVARPQQWTEAVNALAALEGETPKKRGGVKRAAKKK